MSGVRVPAGVCLRSHPELGGDTPLSPAALQRVGTRRSSLEALCFRCDSRLPQKGEGVWGSVCDPWP